MNSKMSPNGAWWGPLLEKAYCKMNVNCANINAGTPLASLRDLTGMPVKKHDVKDLSDTDLYNTIIEAYGNRWPMVSSCINGEYGLQSAHAYSLVEGVTVGGTQLVKVMNPWGAEKYTGPWNDNDSRWTDAYKRQVNLVVADDGIFYMPLSVFRSAFATTQVAMYNDNWKVDRFILKSGTVA